MTKFDVRLAGFSCSGLPALDTNGYSDPFLKIIFDKGYRDLKTPVKTKGKK